MLKVDQMQNYSYDEAHCGYGNSSDAIGNATSNGSNIAGFEFFPSRQDEMFSNTGVSSRRFSGSDDFSNFHSANFAGMNTSSVISTRSGGGPRKDFTAIVGNDRHAVSGFDLFNDIPTDRVFLDGVRNGYALIEEGDFWSVDNKINHTAKAGRPDEGNNAASKTSRKPILNIQSSDQSQNYAGAYSAGFGSKDFGIGHSPILSHNEISGMEDANV
jgi:hypothetical protein